MSGRRGYTPPASQAFSREPSKKEFRRWYSASLHQTLRMSHIQDVKGCLTAHEFKQQGDVMVMTQEELQARYEHCKQNLLCFVSLKPITGKPGRLFNERDFPQIHFTKGEMIVLEEYVKY